MFRMCPLLLAVSLLFCWAPHADAQQAGAVEAGRKFAERVCGNCQVTAAGPILDPPAPSEDKQKYSFQRGTGMLTQINSDDCLHAYFVL